MAKGSRFGWDQVLPTSLEKATKEGMPFANGAYDAVLSECSFCTFADKASAAAEMARVLRSGGRLGLTDMTVHGALPEDLQGLLAWVACVAGAGRPEDYVATLREAGFSGLKVEDHGETLLDMVANVRRKLLGVELAAKLGKVDLGGLDLAEGKRLARRAVALIEAGVVGYTLLTARKAVEKRA